MQIVFPNAPPVLGYMLLGLSILCLGYAAWIWREGRGGFLSFRGGGPLMTLVEVRKRAHARGWAGFGDNEIEALDLIHGLREAALHGTIVAYARAAAGELFPSVTRDEVRWRIDARDWNDMEISAVGVLGDNSDNFETFITSRRSESHGAKLYRDVHFERAGIMKWLRGAEAGR